MFYRISASIRYCVVGDAVIFLDLNQTRYFRLPAACGAAFLHMVDDGGRVGAGDASHLVPLVEAGHIIPASEPGYPFLPQTDFSVDAEYDMLSERTSFALMMRAFVLQLAMAAKFRMRSFQSVLGHLQTLPLAPVDGDEPVDSRLRKLGAAFNAADYLLGRVDRCLVRSSALFAACRSSGIPATLVVGVHPEPFAAHCWLQREGAVLFDRLEHVRHFTPILLIE